MKKVLPIADWVLMNGTMMVAVEAPLSASCPEEEVY
jgi:hypothetical protein